VAGILAAGPAAAQTIMRCEDGTISLGDSAITVARACGAADAVTRSFVQRSLSFDARGRAMAGGVFTETRTVPVERWEYLGSRGRLTRTLVFEDGILIDLRLGGYGR
jgi:hypothetical protein